MLWRQRVHRPLSQTPCQPLGLSGHTICLNVRFTRAPSARSFLLGTLCAQCCCTAPRMTSTSPCPRLKHSLRAVSAFLRSRKSLAVPKLADAALTLSSVSLVAEQQRAAAGELAYGAAAGVAIDWLVVTVPARTTLAQVCS